MIELKNISKCFTTANGERIQAIKDVSLAIHEHEFISIIGPSGCGKSTLLRIVSELQERDGGEIVFHDNTLKENLGFVFQDSVLFPWKSVYENIIMPLEIKHQKTPESLMRVEKLLELMKLKDFRNSLPKELSGGMKQRRLWKQTKKTILFVTHDIEEAVFLSTRVAVLSNRPSKIRDIITIDLPQERSLKLREAIEFTDYVSRLRGMLNEQA